MKKNPFQILGFDPTIVKTMHPDSLSDLIRSHYRALSLANHPDTNPGSKKEKKFLDIRDAYSEISSPNNELYDYYKTKFINVTLKSTQIAELEKHIYTNEAEAENSLENMGNYFSDGIGNPVGIFSNNLELIITNSLLQYNLKGEISTEIVSKKDGSVGEYTSEINKRNTETNKLQDTLIKLGREKTKINTYRKLNLDNYSNEKKQSVSYQNKLQKLQSEQSKIDDPELDADIIKNYITLAENEIDKINLKIQNRGVEVKNGKLEEFLEIFENNLLAIKNNDVNVDLFKELKDTVSEKYLELEKDIKNYKKYFLDFNKSFSDLEEKKKKYDERKSQNTKDIANVKNKLKPLREELTELRKTKKEMEKKAKDKVLTRKKSLEQKCKDLATSNVKIQDGIFYEIAESGEYIPTSYQIIGNISVSIYNKLFGELIDKSTSRSLRIKSPTLKIKSNNDLVPISQNSFKSYVIPNLKSNLMLDDYLIVGEKKEKQVQLYILGKIIKSESKL